MSKSDASLVSTFAHTNARTLSNCKLTREVHTMHLIVIVFPGHGGRTCAPQKGPAAERAGRWGICSHLLHITLFDDDDDTTKGSAQSCFHFVFLIKEHRLDDIGEKLGNTHELVPT